MSVAAGLDRQIADKALEDVQYHPLSGADPQQAFRKLEVTTRDVARRNSFSGSSTPFEDLVGPGSSGPHRRRQH